MRHLIVSFSLLSLLVTACTFEIQTFPNGEQTQTSGPVPEAVTPGIIQTVEGPNINYNGIRFILDPTLGSRLYVYNEAMTIDGATAHSTRFAPNAEEYCQTWCLIVYPAPEFKQAFGSFVFPPAGYRGGANIIFEAQKKSLSFQNGGGDRSLETFGQNHYGVSNESLKYVFRGYTPDQQYAVYVQIPVRAASLPDVEPTMTTNNDPVQDILRYNQQATETMNALVPAEFTPNLDLLDVLVTSIQVGTP